MANNLSHNLDKLKSTFHNILLLRNDVTKVKTQVNTKILELKTIYGELSKTTTKKALLFSLDSFFFQYKLFSVELENIDRFRILLNNRMYCDYYKLYTLIVNYIKDNSDDLSADQIEFYTFPPYKDLDPFQEYNLDDIKHIHQDIMRFINFLYECYEINQAKITNYNNKTRIGFSISNLLNTLEHENCILKQQISLYVNYLSFFHISQTKHIKTLLIRLKDFDNEIEDNVNGNHAYSVDDVEEADTLRKFDYNEDDEEHETPTTDAMMEPIEEETLETIQQFNNNNQNQNQNETTKKPGNETTNEPGNETVNITLILENNDNPTSTSTPIVTDDTHNVI